MGITLEFLGILGNYSGFPWEFLGIFLWNSTKTFSVVHSRGTPAISFFPEKLAKILSFGSCTSLKLFIPLEVTIYFIILKNFVAGLIAYINKM